MASMSQSQSAEDAVVELKRRAIALKEAGENNGALALLAQARDLEFATAAVGDFEDPLKLKQLAVVLKKKGDLESAKQALLKAKQIEQVGGAAPTQAQQSTPATPALKEAQDTAPECTPKQQQETSPHADETAEEDEELLKELQNDNNGADDEAAALAALDLVTFTLEEMLDQEMMTEFHLGGMPVPSQEDYQAKILECKKAALAAKQAGNTGMALQHLNTSKRLESVRIHLSHMSEGLGLRANEDEDQWIESLNKEESALLGELLSNNNNNAGSHGDFMENVLEELSQFMDDPHMLMDAINMGMEVPSAREIQKQAEEQKAKAVQCKQGGDLEGAKAALLQSKKLAAHADQLERVMKLMEQQDRGGGGGGAVDDTCANIEDLEAMLDAEENKKTAKKSTIQAEPLKAQQPKLKSSEELRQEAIRLRDEKKIAEATQVLKLYKEALQREQQEADVKRRQELVKEIREEMNVAQEQHRIWEFHRRLVEPDTQQIELWKEYCSRCDTAAKIIAAKGTQAVNITRKTGTLLCAKTKEEASNEDFNAIVTALIDEGTQNAGSTDERLEISIINVQKIAENVNLQKLLKKQKRENALHPFAVRVDVEIQLPPSETEIDNSIELSFEKPTTDEPDSPPVEGAPPSASSCYRFPEPTQYVDLPRGNSAYAKALRRRIERNKRIHVNVSHEVVPPKAGWFWSKKKSAGDLPPPAFLGKIVLGLEPLMTGHCLAAGEYPLMNGSGTKLLGGTVNMAVRTGVSFGGSPPADPALADVPVATTASISVSYEAMVFSTAESSSASDQTGS